MKAPITRRILLFTLFSLTSVITLYAILNCKERVAVSTKFALRDTTINPSNSYSDLFIDSTVFEQFLLQAKVHDSLEVALRNFYKSRNYEYAWINSEGFNEQAYNFQNLLSDYIGYSGDSTVYDPLINELQDSADKKWASYLQIDSNRLSIEMTFSASFLRYARRTYQGNIRLHQDDLNWFIPRRRINPMAIIDSFANHKENLLTEPLNRQYALLKEKLLKYYHLLQDSALRIIPIPKKEYHPGNHLPAVTVIKQRLHYLGEYSTDTNRFYSKSLQRAVAHFQEKHGLKNDGIANIKTVQYLNKPVEQWVKQILVNMERMRWVPAQPTGDFIVINIPQFYLTVFENGQPSFGMNIVVGTTQNRTVIFTGIMKYVVFAPYWNVPPGILKKEILPFIKQNKNYLVKNHMEWFKGGVRQAPGPWNALGKVKFLFPNNYNIYLHDSPSKSLFEQNDRAFSHGCIRLQEPAKMAQWVLRNQSSWTEEKIDGAMNGTQEIYVTLKKPIPVFVGYFTAWVDENGELNFRDDIYCHDEKMGRYLFTN